MLRVELINIGTELLMGFAINTHAAFIGQKLTAIGANLSRQICINDSAAEIENALGQALNGNDLVVVTGGLGPTSDDITRDLVVKILKLNTHVDERALKNVESRFRRREVHLPEMAKSQAIVPDAATVLYNEHGTAPGLAIPVKGYRCRWLILLPGPPRELRPMFDVQVVPILKKEYGAELPILDCRVFKVAGMGESSVAEKVEPILKGIDDLEIGYCARNGEVDLRLIVRGNDLQKVKSWADEAEQRVRQILGNCIFGMGEDTLEATVISLLTKKSQSVATAESCTGGYLANRLTMVPGSSHVFREGWITYSNAAKTKLLGVPGHLVVEHGAVSEPVAQAMVEGVLQKSEADYAISITGIAGPDGGVEGKPVGTVFIGMGSKKGVKVERFLFPYDRETFKFVTSQTALNLLRLELLRKTS
jgi:nicotinamide-nucleotide amidase